MEQIFVSSVQKELQADRYAVRDFLLLVYQIGKKEP